MENTSIINFSNLSRTFFLISLMIIYSNVGLAFNHNVILEIKNLEAENSSIYFESENLIITASIEECKSPERSVILEYVMLHFQNKTNKPIKIQYAKEAYYDGVCSSCGSSEAEFSLVLKPNETISGSCNVEQSKALRVFSSFKTGESSRKLTNLKIVNVSTLIHN